MRTTAPADDAPLDVLLAYWRGRRYTHDEDGPHPSERTRARFLEALREGPEFLPDLLRVVPRTGETRALVRAVMDGPTAEMLGAERAQQVRLWLDETTAEPTTEELAAAIHDRELWRGYIASEVEGAAEQLLERDPALAEHQLRRLTEPSHAAWAVSLLLPRAEPGTRDERVLRARLREVAGNPEATPFARNLSIETLMTSEWAGRDEWFLALFEDATLEEVRGDSFLYFPLRSVVAAAPERLVPLVVPLVAREARHTRYLAVTALLDVPDPQALRAVIPWLFDIAWCRSGWSGTNRATYVYALRDTFVPEAREGLITIARTSDGVERTAAMEALAGAYAPIALQQAHPVDQRRGGLVALHDEGGPGTGVAAVLLGHTAGIDAALRGGLARQRGVLAGARFANRQLPLELVRPLAEIEALRRFVSAYLVADGRPAAQVILRAMHPDDYLVLGGDAPWDPGHFSLAALGAARARLVARTHAVDGPEEIYALTTYSYFGGSERPVIIEIRGDEATIGSGEETRPLPALEVLRLRALLRFERVLELPPLFMPVHDGVQYELLHLTRTGGRRLFMNNPGDVSGSAYDAAVRLFRRLDGLYGAHKGS